MSRSGGGGGADLRQLVTVHGEAVVPATPTKASVQLSIVSIHKTSSRAAQDANAEKVNLVLDALRNTRLSPTFINSQASLQPVYSSNYGPNEKEELLRWEARTTFTYEVDQQVADGIRHTVAAAVQAAEGVRVNGVKQMLDPTTKDRDMLVALGMATQRAQEKLDIILTQIGATALRIVNITESSSFASDDSAMPFYAAQAMRSADEAASSESTAAGAPVLLGVIDVRGIVTMTAEIRHLDEYEPRSGE
jgi:uncharacterized protein YggE